MLFAFRLGRDLGLTFQQVMDLPAWEFEAQKRFYLREALDQEARETAAQAQRLAHQMSGGR